MDKATQHGALQDKQYKRIQHKVGVTGRVQHWKSCGDFWKGKRQCVAAFSITIHSLYILGRF